MELEAFDTMPTDDAQRVVAVWADVPWWTAALVAGRPYADLAALRDTADELARRWSGADVDRALAAHPRIGEPPSGAGAHAAASRQEQAASAGADTSTAAEIRAGNAAYEQRFGRVFLIRAAGRSAPEILAELTRRLALDDASEAAEAAVQLREIALLRLDGDLRAAAGVGSETVDR